MLIKEDVVWAYRLYLDREPEDEGVILEHLKNCQDRRALARSFLNSPECNKHFGGITPSPSSPFWHYASSFDAIGFINKWAKEKIQPSSSHITNFLGVKIRPEFFPNIFVGTSGTVEPTPIPANWHADIAEWASCLRSVDLSGDRFVMLELGCGWGCWMNNLGVAAKSVGKKIKLYGIEADQEHLRFARLALNDNGITEKEFCLSHGIAGKRASVALFPRIESGADWGGGCDF